MGSPIEFWQIASTTPIESQRWPSHSCDSLVLMTTSWLNGAANAGLGPGRAARRPPVAQGTCPARRGAEDPGGSLARVINSPSPRDSFRLHLCFKPEATGRVPSGSSFPWIVAALAGDHLDRRASRVPFQTTKPGTRSCNKIHLLPEQRITRNTDLTGLFNLPIAWLAQFQLFWIAILTTLHPSGRTVEHGRPLNPDFGSTILTVAHMR